MGTAEKSLGGMVETSEEAAAPERAENHELIERYQETSDRRFDFLHRLNPEDEVGAQRALNLWLESGEDMIKFLLQNNVAPSSMTHSELFGVLEELWVWSSHSPGLCDQHPLMKDLREECLRRLRGYYESFGVQVQQFIFRQSGAVLYIDLFFDPSTYDRLQKEQRFFDSYDYPQNEVKPGSVKVQLDAKLAGGKLTFLPKKKEDPSPSTEVRSDLSKVVKLDDAGSLGKA